MKRLIKISMTAMICLLILCTSVFVSYAETTNAATLPSDAATVNGQSIKVGDTFTYTFNVSDAEQKITGMQINIFFDQDVLELLEVTDGVLGGNSTINDNQGKDGRIVLVNSFMNGGGLECKEKTALATATFKVIAPETTEVTYFVQYLYDIDMIDIYSYTFTCDMTSGDTAISENKTPILADGSLTDVLTALDNFRNNQEGKGDGIKRDPVTVNPNAGGSAADNNTEENAAATTTADDDGDEKKSNTGVIIALTATVAIVGAIAGVVIYKLKTQSTGESDEIKNS